MDNELALRLRVEMAIQGRRPTDVARDAGVSLPTLSRILHAKQSPSNDLLRRIEAAIRQDGERHG